MSSLIRIANESSAEQRMAKVVVWYFESLRSCQLEMAAARKPFNPILGEQFKCVWNVPDGTQFNAFVFFC